MTTIDGSELKKFRSVADQWWNPEGKFRVLHEINPLRLDFINFAIKMHADTSAEVSVLDVGCGGGLIAIPLAELGYRISALEPESSAMDSAVSRAEERGLSSKIDFFTESIESFAKRGKKVDVVLALEVIEHVADIGLFVESISSVLKPGGLLCVSTINRNVKSFFCAIAAAEYVLRWLPKGTHQWKKFITPAELSACLRQFRFKPLEFAGLQFDLLSRKWKLDKKLNVNYLALFKSHKAP